MNESTIINAIENRVRSAKTVKYSWWTIGITEDPDRRKQEHSNPEHWMQWKADSETIARSVEKYFLEKGMKGAAGGGDHPNWVYIF